VAGSLDTATRSDLRRFGRCVGEKRRVMSAGTSSLRVCHKERRGRGCCARTAQLAGWGRPRYHSTAARWHSLLQVIGAQQRLQTSAPRLAARVARWNAVSAGTRHDRRAVAAWSRASCPCCVLCAARSERELWAEKEIGGLPALAWWASFARLAPRLGDR
jgi:hypothetical protein